MSTHFRRPRTPRRNTRQRDASPRPRHREIEARSRPASNHSSRRSPTRGESQQQYIQRAEEDLDTLAAEMLRRQQLLDNEWAQHEAEVAERLRRQLNQDTTPEVTRSSSSDDSFDVSSPTYDEPAETPVDQPAISINAGRDFDSVPPRRARTNRRHETRSPARRSAPRQPSDREPRRTARVNLPRLNEKKKRRSIEDWVQSTENYRGVCPSEDESAQQGPFPPKKSVVKRGSKKTKSSAVSTDLELAKARVALEQAKLDIQLEKQRTERAKADARIARARSQPGASSANPPSAADDQHVVNQDVMMCLLRNFHRAQGTGETKFSGDPLRYPYFIRHFKNSVLKMIHDKASCFQILLNECTGEALKTIEHLGIYEDPAVALSEALKLLEQNYGNKPVLVQSYLDELTKGPEIKDTADGLRSYLSQIRTCQTVFNDCGEANALDQISNLQPIWQRLPPPVRTRFHQLTLGVRPTRLVLVQAIEERLASKLDHVGQWVQEEKRNKRLRTNFTRGGLPNEKKGNNPEQAQPKKLCCPCCNSSDLHALHECAEFMKLEAKARHRTVRNAKYCYGCLIHGHHIKDCPGFDTLKCNVDGCTRKHHPALHSDRPPRRRPRRQNRTDAVTGGQQ